MRRMWEGHQVAYQGFLDQHAEAMKWQVPPSVLQESTTMAHEWRMQLTGFRREIEDVVIVAMTEHMTTEHDD